MPLSGRRGGRAGVLRHHGEPREPLGRADLGQAGRACARRAILRGRRHPFGGRRRSCSQRGGRKNLDQLTGARQPRAHRRSGPALRFAVRRRWNRQPRARAWASTRQFSGDPQRARDSGRDVASWVREVQERGAGEIVLNCIGADGTRAGLRYRTAARGACDVRRAAGRLRRCRHRAALCRCLQSGRGGCSTRRKRLPFRIYPHPGAQARAARPRNCRAADRRGGSMNCAASLGVAELDSLDFAKGGGLLPVVVQHAGSGAVLDARLHEPRGTRSHTRARPGRIFQPQQEPAVGKRRDLRPWADPGAGSPRLRPRCAAGECLATGAGVPYGQPHLLRARALRARHRLEFLTQLEAVIAHASPRDHRPAIPRN